MRIIAGLAKGMVLTVPRGDDTRPTSDRVREAVFSSLGERVVGATVLDLFAGTGALGFEAASRGARVVTFVERARAVCDVIVKNETAFMRNREIACEFSVVCTEVFSYLKHGGKFDLVFADPPYGETAQLLLRDAKLREVLAENGRLVVESAKRSALTIAAPWGLVREGIYGDTRVSIFKPV